MSAHHACMSMLSFCLLIFILPGMGKSFFLENRHRHNFHADNLCRFDAIDKFLR
jgi:hypothetical protein